MSATLLVKNWEDVPRPLRGESSQGERRLVQVSFPTQLGKQKEQKNSRCGAEPGKRQREDPWDPE